MLGARKLVSVALAVLWALVLGAGTAQAAVIYGRGFSFTSPEGLSGPVGLAVDQSSGDVYVVDQGNNALKKFSVSGQTATQVWKAEMPGAIPNQATVDDYTGEYDGDVFVAGYGSGKIYRISSAGALLASPIEGLSNPTDVAVDAAGDFFVSSIGNDTVSEFNSKWEPVNAEGKKDADNTVIEGLEGPQALAVSENGQELYVATGTGTLQYEPAGEFYMPIAGIIGGPSSGVTIAPPGHVLVDEDNKVTEYEPLGEPLRNFGSGALSGAYGVGIYEGRTFVADNAANQVEVFEYQSVSDVGEAGAASEVGETSATLSAPINPHGMPATYYFEYGLTEAYGSRTPSRAVVAREQIIASADLIDLAPATHYHFRIVVEAENSVREAGPDANFSTLPIGIPGLPDGRVYEMVDPAENQDAEIYMPLDISGGYFYQEGGGSVTQYGIGTRFPFQAAAAGNAIAYVGDPTSPGEGERGDTKGNEYLATRDPHGGWTQINLEPPGYAGAHYQAFSSELSQGILVAESNELKGLPPLTSNSPVGAGLKVLYARATDADAYSPLFTSTPPDESEEGFGTSNGENRVEPTRYAGASANWEETLFEANDSLTPNAINGGLFENNLYVSVAGSLSAVNILPGQADSEPDAVFGAPALLASGEGAATPDLSHVISSNGSRIFWTDLNEGPDQEHLYVRENATTPSASTVAVSAGAARYWAATPEGTEVLYSEAGALMRFDVETDTREVLAPASAELQGVLGTSEDGDYIYFAADGVLASGARPGEPNLYLLHNEGGGWEAPKLVATLSPEDGTEAEPEPYPFGARVGDWEPSLAVRTAEVTPDGQGLVFDSKLSLPTVGDPEGYDNIANGSQRMDEVYTYQAGEGGHLYCASCNPSGEAPQTNYETKHSYAAAFLPIGFDPTHQPRWISEDGGRVFFDSTEPLVARDTNGEQDAYEWERDGEGSCSQVSGCIYLLSNGTSKDASFFIDASASGEDAFIVTTSDLTPEDRYETFNLFDARVGGVRPVSPPVCTDTGCQGVPAAPPTFATPPTVTFSGVGNLTPTATKSKSKAKRSVRPRKLSAALKVCKHKRTKRERVRCKAAAQKRYGSPSKKIAKSTVREAR
jgi:hypothetical protein